MYCTKCGKKLLDESRFCTQCGQPVTAPGNTDEFRKDLIHKTAHIVIQNKHINKKFDLQNKSVRVNNNRINKMQNKSILPIILFTAAIIVATGMFLLVRGYFNDHNHNSEIELLSTVPEDDVTDQGPSVTPYAVVQDVQIRITQIDTANYPEVGISFTVTDEYGNMLKNISSEDLIISERIKDAWTAVSRIAELNWFQDTQEFYMVYKSHQQNQWCDLKLELQSDYYCGTTEGGYFAEAISKEEIDNSVIISVSASSELGTQSDSGGDYNYYAENIMDGNSDTAWVEGVDGNGVGEWIQLDFDGIHSLNGIEINNGYQKSEYAYGINGRPKEIRISFSDGSYEDFMLEDDFNESQKLNFSEPHEMQYMMFQILSVYEGTKYPDTCISDIAVY